MDEQVSKSKKLDLKWELFKKFQDDLLEKDKLENLHFNTLAATSIGDFASINTLVVKHQRDHKNTPNWLLPPYEVA